MRIKFNTLETRSSQILVSFDAGKSYKRYDVSDIKKNGSIEFTEDDCDDFSKIVIKGKIKTLADLDTEIQGISSTQTPAIPTEDNAHKTCINDTKTDESTTYSSSKIELLLSRLIPAKKELDLDFIG